MIVADLLVAAVVTFAVLMAGLEEASSGGSIEDVVVTLTGFGGCVWSVWVLGWLLDRRERLLRALKGVRSGIYSSEEEIVLDTGLDTTTATEILEGGWDFILD